MQRYGLDTEQILLDKILTDIFFLCIRNAFKCLQRGLRLKYRPLVHLFCKYHLSLDTVQKMFAHLLNRGTGPGLAFILGEGRQKKQI